MMAVDYFEAVAQAILSAKSEIYIEDWWLVSIYICVHSIGTSDSSPQYPS